MTDRVVRTLDVEAALIQQQADYDTLVARTAGAPADGRWL